MSLIVIEGPDCSGKNTVADALARQLGAKRLDFPDRTNTVTGPLIDGYLKRRWRVECREADGSYSGKKADDLAGALAFQALQVTNRMEHFWALSAAKQSATEHLVLVRYWQSGWVYGQLDGLDPVFLRGVHRGLPQPDLNILLDVSAEECERRRAARDGAKAPEIYEGKLAFTRRVIDLYRACWAEGARTGIGWIVVDAARPAAEVVETIWRRHGVGT